MKKKLVSILLSLSMCATYAMPLAAAGPEAPEAPEVVETAAPMATYTTTPKSLQADAGVTNRLANATFSGEIESTTTISVKVVGGANGTTDADLPEENPIEWSSSNPTVATVEADSAGSTTGKAQAQVKILAAGKTTIKATSSELKGTKTVTYTLNVNPKDIKKTSIEWTQPSTYFKDIAAFKASFAKVKKGVMTNLTIKDKDHPDNVLTRDKDYVLTVSGNGSFTKAGKSVTVKITGKGNYDTKTNTAKAIEVNFYAQNVTYGTTKCSLTFGDSESDKLNDSIVLDGVSLSSISNTAEKALKYKSSDKSKVAVDKNGKLTAKNVGEAIITAIPKNNTNAKQPTDKNKKFVVVVTAKALTADSISFDAEKNIKLAKAYKDPNAFKSKFIDKANKLFTVKDGKKKLKGGSSKDYVVTVSGKTITEMNGIKDKSNNAEDTNRVKYTITGKGNFKGTITGTFVVPLQCQGFENLDGIYSDFEGNDISFGEKYNLYDVMKIQDSTYKNFTVPDGMKEKCKKLKFEPQSTDVKVNKNGIMTIKKVPTSNNGQVKIKVSPTKNPQAVSTVSIAIKKADITDYQVKFKAPKGKEKDTEVSQAFNKSSVKVISTNGKKLKNGTDFDVTTVQAAGGTLTVTVKGKGNYDQTASGTASYTLKQPKTTK